VTSSFVARRSRSGLSYGDVVPGKRLELFVCFLVREVSTPVDDPGETKMASRGGFEPPTRWLTASRSGL
jgi:hypothetical protein